MKITILNGAMDVSDNDFSVYLEKLSEKFNNKHTCELYNLKKMKLHYCTGCFNCWWKTPGKCILKDEIDPILFSVIHSDFLIFASPLMAGFTSSELKKVTDRLIPLLHPYIILKDGECHHKKRYKRYPKIGLILKKEAETDAQDIEIVNDIYDRLAINFHSKRLFTKFIETDKKEEIIDEVCAI